MSRKSVPALKSSFFSLFLLTSVVIIGFIVVLFNSKTRLTTKSGASAPTTVTVASLNDIISILPSYTIGQIVTINVPGSLYKQIYTSGAATFCAQVRWCTGPYDARFVASQNIFSSVTYINSPSNTLVTANYYYLPDGRGKAQISLLGCTLSGRNCSSGERTYFQSLINSAVTQAFNAYYQYVDILAISNDSSNLSIVFKVKTLPPTPCGGHGQACCATNPRCVLSGDVCNTSGLCVASGPTPIPCVDSVPPARPGYITKTGSNPYSFSWGISGCSSNPKKYFFRRYNSATPSGTEPNCNAGDTTSGSCWRTNTSISNVPIDFSNTSCMYYGTDLGCNVYVWAKDANNRVSQYSSQTVYKP